jgi:hypothetical protein
VGIEAEGLSVGSENCVRGAAQPINKITPQSGASSRIQAIIIRGVCLSLFIPGVSDQESLAHDCRNDSAYEERNKAKQRESLDNANEP